MIFSDILKFIVLYVDFKNDNSSAIKNFSPSSRHNLIKSF
jgi:hypothetical protein